MMDKLIEYIELRLVDINGKIRGMTVPLSKPVVNLEEIKKDARIIKGINVDGSSLPGFASVENSDLHLEPDFDSLIELPYLSKRKAAVLCYLYHRDQNRSIADRFLGDARSLLKETMEHKMDGISVHIKPEPEFYLIEDREDQVIPLDQGGYIAVAPNDASTELMMTMVKSLETIGMNVKYFHHEVGPSQQEIELNFTDMMKNLDNLATLKPTLKLIAKQNHAQVTFMPKPFDGEAGNGLHFHLQLFKDGKNLFANEENPSEVSQFAMSFIAGILDHAKAITAVANPSINSFKRLVPGFEAPVYICWGYRNRSTLIRVPMYKNPKDAAIEVRSPDFSTNPYILLNVLLLAGMDGVNRQLVPPTPRSDDVFHLREEELEAEGIETLPSNLGEALAALKKDPIIYSALGPHLGPAWLKTKGEEWNMYNNLSVTDLEIKKYLDC
ncbi:MAG: glutamine synthetase [Candidatus Heimdallarchaeota archaeon]|nr:glutamine synthetase [Candidatus Heimdallarchaeota archaeon]